MPWISQVQKGNTLNPQLLSPFICYTRALFSLSLSPIVRDNRPKGRRHFLTLSFCCSRARLATIVTKAYPLSFSPPLVIRCYCCCCIAFSCLSLTYTHPVKQAGVQALSFYLSPSLSLCLPVFSFSPLALLYF
ncbi:MAG: hypothetical protein J3R72DRAFT_455040 [Linnemannia gamsii]|nr:MAG: hypothetical protein J3R72DRAFT_455040 [Linnemannia gamsii]